MTRDPAGYPDGMNTYTSYHSMMGGVDPSGTDFIALADRPLDGPLGWNTPFQFRHYSLEYYRSNSPGPTSPTEIKTYLKANEDAWRIEGVELICESDYRYYAKLANGDPIIRDFGVSFDKKTFHGISVVYFKSSATTFIAVSDSCPPNTQADRLRIRDQWATIRQNASTYQFAEQATTRKELKNWPRSYYDAWGTNSNVFALYMLSSAHLPLDQLPGWHPPGIAKPSQNKFVEPIYGTPWHKSEASPDYPDSLLD